MRSGEQERRGIRYGGLLRLGSGEQEWRGIRYGGGGERKRGKIKEIKYIKNIYKRKVEIYGLFIRFFFVNF